MSVETIVCGATDGPVNTAGTRASAIPTANRIVLPNNFFYIGRAIRFLWGGRLSCAVTTPGTFRWDIAMGSAGTTIVFDTLALNGNIVAKTTVPYIADVTLVCRAVGTATSTTFFPTGFVQSEALIGAGLPTVSGNTSLAVPVGTPAVGAGMDNTAASAIDLFYTQSLGTASHTMHNYIIQVLN
jgi:hypothetical protein